MNFELVEVLTEQKIFLQGCLQNNNSDKCILFIPGMCANFFEKSFPKALIEKSKHNGYDFLYSHNQGSFQVADYNYYDASGKLKSKTIGSTYEYFENCIYDIDAWLNFLKKRKYKEVIVIAHSLGCNKVVYYFSQKKSKIVKKIVLLSAQDNVNFNDLEMHEGLLQEAINNIENGEPEKILSKKFLGFCLMSSATYYNEVNNKNLNNIPYKSSNSDFSLLKKIDLPMFFVIGSKDGGENSENYMKTACVNAKNAVYAVIADANHIYKGKEEELGDVIFGYLNRG